MGQTILRRRATQDAGLDERRFWLRFTTGKIVDPRTCPKGIHAHSHWHRLDTPVADGEPNCVCDCIAASPIGDATASVPMAEGGGRAPARSSELVTPGSPVGQEPGGGAPALPPAPSAELQRLGAVNVRVDGSSTLGTFVGLTSDGSEAHVRVSPLDPMPEPTPLPDGRARYRFTRLGTWGGYVDVEADR